MNWTLDYTESLTLDRLERLKAWLIEPPAEE